MEKEKIQKLTPVYTDDRGAIWDILEGVEIRHLGYITSKKDVVRGNHYHKQAHQYLFMLRGRAQWYTKDMKDEASEAQIHTIEAGDMTFVAPNIAHAFVALEYCEFLDVTNISRDSDGYEEDTVRHQLTQ